MEWKKELNEIANVLKSGGLLLYPTDTIWGIGCDATNDGAVERVFELKKREPEKSMIVLLDNEHRLDKLVNEIPLIAFQLIDVADKPLTIVYPGGRNVAKKVLGADGTIAVRITKDIFCCEIIRKLNKPLLSTSANVSGVKSDGTFNSIPEEIIKGVDYVVKYRRDDNSKRPASQVIKLGLGGEIAILRR